MTVDELQVLITANTEQLRKQIASANKDIQSLQKTATKSSGSMVSAVLKGNIATKLLAKGIQLISQHMDEAVTRLDALNNFPRVMSNLGISQEDAEASMKRLSDALVGLPTTLDTATMSVQRFTSANGNVKASTEIFLALNNAILSGGADMSIQKSALEQLSQAYAKGKPDMMEWRTAMTAMPAQLKQVAMAMGYASADQLGESLRNGTVSMNEFMVKITELNKRGLNGFQSFEEQARNSTGGVATSITNVKTALVRGLADIMNAIGQSNIAGFFQGIAKAINTVIPYVVAFVKVMAQAVSFIAGLFGKKSKGKEATNTINNTSSALGGLGSAGASSSKGLDKASGSAKKLKKELNGLASFDEMNVLKEADDTSSGGGGGDVDAGGGIGDLSGIDLSGFDNLSDTSSKVDEIMAKFSKLGDILKGVWNSEPVQAFVGAMKTYGQFLWDYWSTLGTNLWNNIVTTWNNISDNVSTIWSNLTQLWTQFWTDIDMGIQTWGQPIIDGVMGVFNSIWFDVIDPAIQIISKAWADFSGILLSLWEKHGKPLIDNIGEFATNVIALFQSIWDNILKPIVEPFLEMLSWLWDTHLKGMVEKVGDFIGKLINGALEIYNKFIQPIVMWLLEKLGPAFSFLGSLISGVLGTVLGVISDVFGAIFEILGGVIDFIVGIFTGNWEKAWNGVKSIFSGIVNALVGIFKLPINLIIDVINAFISGLNKIKIPDWVPGVGGRGFHIDKIPKLARGGVIDKPTLSVVGEAGKEAIMPLEHNTGWINQLGEKIVATMGTISSGEPIHLTVNIGEDTILDKIVDGINNKAFENNGEVFSI